MTLQELKYKLKTLDVFGKIIVINTIVFVLSFLVKDILGFGIFNYFQLPAHFRDFITQPWSLITYGFTHYGFIHLLLNLIVLYYISKLVTTTIRVKTALNIYVLGILVGGLAFLFAYNVLPNSFLKPSTGLVGASAGVRALIIFLGIYMAEREVSVFIVNIKLKHVAIALITLDVLGLFGNNQGGYIAHLGGAALGYLYAIKLKQGKDIGTGFERSMDTVLTWFKPKPNLKTVHRKKKTKDYAGKTKDDFNTYNKQKKIDLILDKISKSGYESLTSEEKEFLFRAGK